MPSGSEIQGVDFPQVGRTFIAPTVVQPQQSQYRGGIVGGLGNLAELATGIKGLVDDNAGRQLDISQGNLDLQKQNAMYDRVREMYAYADPKDPEAMAQAHAAAASLVGEETATAWGNNFVKNPQALTKTVNALNAFDQTNQQARGAGASQPTNTASPGAPAAPPPGMEEPPPLPTPVNVNNGAGVSPEAYSNTGGLSPYSQSDMAGLPVEPTPVPLPAYMTPESDFSPEVKAAPGISKFIDRHNTDEAVPNPSPDPEVVKTSGELMHKGLQQFQMASLWSQMAGTGALASPEHMELLLTGKDNVQMAMDSFIGNQYKVVPEGIRPYTDARNTFDMANFLLAQSSPEFRQKIQGEMEAQRPGSYDEMVQRVMSMPGQAFTFMMPVASNLADFAAKNGVSFAQMDVARFKAQNQMELGQARLAWDQTKTGIQENNKLRIAAGRLGMQEAQLKERLWADGQNIDLRRANLNLGYQRAEVSRTQARIQLEAAASADMKDIIQQIDTWAPYQFDPMAKAAIGMVKLQISASKGKQQAKNSLVQVYQSLMGKPPDQVYSAVQDSGAMEDASAAAGMEQMGVLDLIKTARDSGIQLTPKSTIAMRNAKGETVQVQVGNNYMELGQNMFRALGKEDMYNKMRASLQPPSGMWVNTPEEQLRGPAPIQNIPAAGKPVYGFISRLVASGTPVDPATFERMMVRAAKENPNQYGNQFQPGDIPTLYNQVYKPMLDARKAKPVAIPPTSNSMNYQQTLQQYAQPQSEEDDY
jgi:hypothetical protein